MNFYSKKINSLKGVRHTFFSRKGGYSRGIYHSLNCGLGSKDIKKNIHKNLILVKKKLKIKKIYLLNQIHSNKVLTIKPNYKKIKIGSADGMFTKEKNIGIGILTADCAPLLFADKESKYICCVHAGWKGAFRNIMRSALLKFKKHKINLKNIFCCIGPCISKQSYEVQKDFKNKIISRNFFYKKFFTKRSSKIYFDLSGYIFFKLTKLGLPKKNIEILNIDTYKNEKYFYSFRRSVHKDEKDYGRNLSIIVKT